MNYEDADILWEDADILWGPTEHEQSLLAEIDALTTEIESLELQAQQAMDLGDDWVVHSIRADIAYLDRRLKDVHDEFMNC